MATRKKTTFLPAGAEQFLRAKSLEASGVFMIAVALALLAALASFHPTDPSLNTATGTAAQNLLGYAGAHVSDILLQTLGLSSVLLAPIAIGWGWRLWKEHALQQPWLRLTLLPIGLLFTAIALAT